MCVCVCSQFQYVKFNMLFSSVPSNHRQYTNRTERDIQNTFYTDNESGESKKKTTTAAAAAAAAATTVHTMNLSHSLAHTRVNQIKAKCAQTLP